MEDKKVKLYINLQVVKLAYSMNDGQANMTDVGWTLV